MLIIFHIKTSWKSKDFEIITFNFLPKFFAVKKLRLFTETAAAI